MDLSLTKARLRSHWTYNWWKYLLVVAGSIFVWNLYYSVTAYRPPAEKVADIYSECFFSMDQTAMDEWLSRVNREEMPDMEEMRAVVMTNDATYGSMQMSVYIGSGVSAIYIVSGDNFQQYASNGYFIPLDDAEIVLNAAENAGINVDKGRRTNSDTYERHLYGIPLTALTGLKDLGINFENSYMAINAGCSNEENLKKLMSIIIREMAPVQPVQ